MMDEAFVSGLLHDAGKAALGFNFAAQYTEVLKQVAAGVDLLAAEKQAFGATHADVGGYLLGLWGLPTPVVEAIALHHQPSLSAGEGFTPLTAVHVANCLTLAGKPGAPTLDTAYLERLHLSDHLEKWQQALLTPANA
jgi:HD-like signal output (HDOD) protein